MRKDSSVSVDATGTARLSYGVVKGYLEDGKKIPPYTFMAGLYERAAQHVPARRLSASSA